MPRREFSILTPQMFYTLIALRKPLYGNQIMEQVKVMTDGEVIVGAGTLYALLPRFLDERYIKIVEETSTSKTYQITKHGEEKLQEEFQRMLKMINIYKEF